MAESKDSRIFHKLESKFENLTKKIMEEHPRIMSKYACDIDDMDSLNESLRQLLRLLKNVKKFPKDKSQDLINKITIWSKKIQDFCSFDEGFNEDRCKKHHDNFLKLLTTNSTTKAKEVGIINNQLTPDESAKKIFFEKDIEEIINSFMKVMNNIDDFLEINGHDVVTLTQQQAKNYIFENSVDSLYQLWLDVKSQQGEKLLWITNALEICHARIIILNAAFSEEEGIESSDYTVDNIKKNQEEFAELIQSDIYRKLQAHFKAPSSIQVLIKAWDSSKPNGTFLAESKKKSLQERVEVCKKAQVQFGFFMEGV